MQAGSVEERVFAKLFHQKRMVYSEADLKKPCQVCNLLPKKIVRGICIKCYARIVAKRYEPTRVKRDSTKTKLYWKQYAIENKLKINARNKITDAVRRGKLTRKPCEKCGLPNAHAHHNDYSKPLDVIWLCHVHHMEIHRKA